MNSRVGGCLCGSVRYQLNGEPKAVTVCHCTHCQKQGGSILSLNLVVKESDYEQQGETAVFVDSGDSGQPVYRHFCARCGSPILVKIAAAPGKVVIKGGSLDNMDGLEPKAEIYTDHAVKWLPPVAGTTRFSQNFK